MSPPPNHVHHNWKHQHCTCALWFSTYVNNGYQCIVKGSNHFKSSTFSCHVTYVIYIWALLAEMSLTTIIIQMPAESGSENMWTYYWFSVLLRNPFNVQDSYVIVELIWITCDIWIIISSHRQKSQRLAAQMRAMGAQENWVHKNHGIFFGNRWVGESLGSMWIRYIMITFT